LWIWRCSTLGIRVLGCNIIHVLNANIHTMFLKLHLQREGVYLVCSQATTSNLLLKHANFLVLARFVWLCFQIKLSSLLPVSFLSTFL
jgi:hypothetical protein